MAYGADTLSNLPAQLFWLFDCKHTANKNDEKSNHASHRTSDVQLGKEITASRALKKKNKEYYCSGPRDLLIVNISIIRLITAS